MISLAFRQVGQWSWIRRIKRSLRGCRPKLSLCLDLFEEEFCLDLFGFLIALPFLDRWHREPHEMMESWGIKYFERSVHLNWGRHCKIVYMPWDMVHIKCETLRPDGSWVKPVASYEVSETNPPDGREYWTAPYHYMLDSGEVQHVTATVCVERREWRQKWLRWCPLFAKRCQYIEISFDGEVGERAGSWKGGCIGCSYDMKKGEEPLETLKRMQRERRFN